MIMNNLVFLPKNTYDLLLCTGSFSSNKMNCTMHFPSTFVHLCLCLISFSIDSLSISHLFSLTCRYRNNEHENDSANSLGLDFEKAVYVGEFSTDEGMEDDDLPQTC